MTCEPELRRFVLLNRAGGRDAVIRKLAAAGVSEHSLASATGLTVEQIRGVVAEAPPEVSPAQVWP